MTEKDLDRLANSGAEMPEGLELADALYFIAKRALYQFARATEMPVEQGMRESAKIRDMVTAYRLDGEYVKACARRTIAVESAATAYRKAGSDTERIAAADWLIEALDGVPLKRGRSNGR